MDEGACGSFLVPFAQFGLGNIRVSRQTFEHLPAIPDFKTPHQDSSDVAVTDEIDGIFTVTNIESKIAASSSKKLREEMTSAQVDNTPKP